MPRELLLLLVLAQVIRAEIKRVDDQRRTEVTAVDGLTPGDRLGVRVPGPDGPVRVGTVRVDPGAAKVEIADERAFLAWVRTNYPTEIVETVRPSFLALIKKRVTEVGEPVTEDGEVIPGLEVTTGEPRVVVTKERDASEQVAAAWRRGDLPELLGALGLEGGLAALED